VFLIALMLGYVLTDPTGALEFVIGVCAALVITFVVAAIRNPDRMPPSISTASALAALNELRASSMPHVTNTDNPIDFPNMPKASASPRHSVGASAETVGRKAHRAGESHTDSENSRVASRKS